MGGGVRSDPRHGGWGGGRVGFWVGIVVTGLVVWRATRLPCAVSAGAKIFRNLSKLVSTKLNPNGSAATTAKYFLVKISFQNTGRGSFYLPAR